MHFTWKLHVASNSHRLKWNWKQRGKVLLNEFSEHIVWYQQNNQILNLKFRKKYNISNNFIFSFRHERLVKMPRCIQKWGKWRISISRTEGTKIILHFFKVLFYIDIVISEMVLVLPVIRGKKKRRGGGPEPRSTIFSLVENGIVSKHLFNEHFERTSLNINVIFVGK